MKFKGKHSKKSSKPYIITTILAVILTSIALLFILTKDNEPDNNSFSNSSDKENLSNSENFSEDSSDESAFSHSSSEYTSDLPVKAALSADKFTSENGHIYYEGDEVVYGIDVSKFQGNIDWQQVANDGIGFVMIRAGLRGYVTPNLVEDPMCRTNIEGALKAGLKVGLYVFSQSVTTEEAIQEAEFIADIAQDYNITYPLVFDWERVKSNDSRTREISGEQVTLFAAAFCEKIKELGYNAAFYFNPNNSSSGINPEELSDYIFWMAEYETTVPNLDYDFHMWQYSNTGRIAGIDGDVDLNICFYALPSLEGETDD